MDIFNNEFVNAVNNTLSEASANDTPMTPVKVAEALGLTDPKAAEAVRIAVQMLLSETYTTRRGTGGGFISYKAEARFRESLAAKETKAVLTKVRREARKKAKQALKERLEAEIDEAVARAEEKLTSAAEETSEATPETVEEEVSAGLETYLTEDDSDASETVAV